VGGAISQAMGYKPLVFLNVYYENIGRPNIEAIEANNPLGQAITKFCEEEEELENKAWNGSPGKLLEQLKLKLPSLILLNAYFYLFLCLLLAPSYPSIHPSSLVSHCNQ
jgi:hypothetical protein